ncbi:membrane protein [Catellatospora sp. TT07R-123]|uniref:AEC family transporter n=1 Tax=Catellatospora sp. TT07R-123 TaxID=2733863 RepID=UPI001B14BD80|nr:AEC family transporter [Catellatospora sp. TT07R-123]GHJ49498.1 membrane protein [Catellatospora sp. TT07R-123]
MLAAFAPIWMITALGWGTIRFGVLTRATQQALAAFTFLVAIPAVLFTTLAKTPLGGLPLRPLAAFALSTLAIGLLAYMLARRLLPGRNGDRVIAAMSAAYVNSGNLGIPVAVYVLRDVSLITAVLVFQTMLVTPLIVGLLDADANGGQGRWRRIALLPLRTPVILGSLFGVLASASGWHPPDWLLHPLELLGGAAVPAALFALGMSLHRDPAAPDAEPVAGAGRGAGVGVAVVLKVLAQPLAAYLAGRFLFHLGPAELVAVTVVAGLPTAQNTFVYATEYRAGADFSRDAILVSSLLSMATLTAILYLTSG